MVVVEGVARDLDPAHNIWESSRPVVEKWMRETLSPEHRIREAASGVGDFGRELRAIVQSAATAANHLAQTGIRLHPDSASAIAEAEARRNAPTRWAIWIGALALVVIAVRMFV
jgi:ubiquinone biosynthesis protein